MDAVTDVVEAISAQDRRRLELPVDMHVQVTPLEYGDVLVEVACPVDHGYGRGRCCPNQDDTGWGWRWVDRGRVQGCWSAQCGGCGSQSAGWTGDEITVHPADDSVAARVHALVAEVRQARSDFERRATSRVEREVLGMLAAVRSEVVDGGLRWDAEVTEWVDTDGDCVSVAGRGSQIQPGWYVAGSCLVAWDYEPGGEGECIVEEWAIPADHVLKDEA